MDLIKHPNVKIKSIASTADGAIYGLGSDDYVYIWHHSLASRGHWVLNVKETSATSSFAEGVSVKIK